MAIFSEMQFVNPVTDCLNNHTIPRIAEKTPPQKIVDEAYFSCKKEVKTWQEGQRDLSEEMQAQHNKEMYDFYIRMIEIRRKATHHPN
ncbi:hypothetical protein OGM23_02005 [Dickeya fangzhongdai]|uniref:hypothetical protein n=1 Tax=Dickeya fangzhongdai TaxID=1778540 RepID=UPI002B312482|nr:hypothetical protein OGM23_02005 [Dickeya fangzhongdai]